MKNNVLKTVVRMEFALMAFANAKLYILITIVLWVKFIAIILSNAIRSNLSRIFRK